MSILCGLGLYWVFSKKIFELRGKFVIVFDAGTYWKTKGKKSFSLNTFFFFLEYEYSVFDWITE